MPTYRGQAAATTESRAVLQTSITVETLLHSKYLGLIQQYGKQEMPQRGPYGRVFDGRTTLICRQDREKAR